MDSFRLYSLTFLATPAVSRKSCASKESPFRLLPNVFGFLFILKHRLDANALSQADGIRGISLKLCKREQHAAPVAYSIAFDGGTDLYWPVSRDVRYPSSCRSTFWILRIVFLLQSAQ